MRLLVVILLVAVASAQVLPTCSWMCDSPVCEAACENRCAPSNCTITPPGSCTDIPGPSCSTSCPAVNDTTVCPACSTLCADLPLVCSMSTILCAPPVCGYECFKPSSCPYPTCELVCALPGCTAPSWGNILSPSLGVLMGVFALVAVTL